jgi:hypothetical protein
MSRSKPSLRLAFELFLHRQGKAWLALCLLGGLAIAAAGVEITTGYWHWQELLAKVASSRQQLSQLTLAASSSAKETAALETERAMQSEKLVEADLNKIFEIAFKNELELPQGDYQWSVDPNSPFKKYQISYPVVAEYPNVENFVTQVLLALPWAALNGYEIRRNSITETDVQAELTFTLFYDGRPETEASRP